MNKIVKYARWTACIPVGLVGGTVLAIAGVGIIDVVLSCTWLTGCIGCGICGFFYPLAVYRLGMFTAPDRDSLSRNLMLLANWLLLFAAFHELADLKSGTSPEAEHVSFLETWWAGFTLSLGWLIGCYRVFCEEDAEQKPVKQSIDFEWGDTSKRCPVAQSHSTH